MSADESLGLPSAFWDRVDKNGPVVRDELGKCWLWAAGKSDNGYGGWYPDRSYGPSLPRRKRQSVHRLALSGKLGRPLLPSMCACHHCDVRACVNPAHLFEGTMFDNARDMITKGRRLTKLTTANVLGIVRRLRGGDSHSVIAADVGVSRRTIYAIATGRKWRHLPQVAELANPLEGGR